MLTTQNKLIELYYNFDISKLLDYVNHLGNPSLLELFDNELKEFKEQTKKELRYKFNLDIVVLYLNQLPQDKALIKLLEIINILGIQSVAKNSYTQLLDIYLSNNLVSLSDIKQVLGTNTYNLLTVSHLRLLTDNKYEHLDMLIDKCKENNEWYQDIMANPYEKFPLKLIESRVKKLNSKLFLDEISYLSKQGNKHLDMSLNLNETSRSHIYNNQFIQEEELDKTLSNLKTLQMLPSCQITSKRFNNIRSKTVDTINTYDELVDLILNSTHNFIQPYQKKYCSLIIPFQTIQIITIEDKMIYTELFEKEGVITDFRKSPDRFTVTAKKFLSDLTTD